MHGNLRRHFEKIISLTDQEADFLAEHFIQKKFKKHQQIIRPGDRVRYNYYIVSGLLKLVYTDDTSREHILSFAMEDWWENDFMAYYTESEATLSLECIEDTEVLCPSLSSFRLICAAMPKLEHFFLEKTTYGFLAAQRRILSLLTTNAKERYEHLIKQHPQLMQRVPKTLLASYLGVSRETLSRLDT